MNDRGATGSIRFYFSFRSPYAWLAAERLEPELGDLGVPIERIPVYPTPALFPNDPATMPAKIAYMVQDIRRLVRERGLTVRFPSATDPDWSLSHAAFLGAQQQGAGHTFMLEAFRKRFCEGLDLGDDVLHQLRPAARRCYVASILLRGSRRCLRTSRFWGNTVLAWLRGITTRSTSSSRRISSAMSPHG